MNVVVLKADWADEHDIVGVRAFTDKEWEKFQADCEAANYPQEKYFGTNQFMEISSCEEYMGWLTVHKINEVGRNFLERIFGPAVLTYGFGLWVEPLE